MTCPPPEPRRRRFGGGIPAALSAEGIEVVPTFRSPHVTLAFAELDTGLEVLETVPHERRENPYHEGERTPT